MIYRNQTNTMAQIQAMSAIRITNSQQAVAFLRALQPLHEQVAAVLQQASLRTMQADNRARAEVAIPTTAPAPAPEVKKVDTVIPEEVKEEDTHSAEDAQKRVAQLKSSSKKK